MKEVKYCPVCDRTMEAKLLLTSYYYECNDCPGPDGLPTNQISSEILAPFVSGYTVEVDGEIVFFP